MPWLTKLYEHFMFAGYGSGKFGEVKVPLRLLSDENHRSHEDDDVMVLLATVWLPFCPEAVK